MRKLALLLLLPLTLGACFSKSGNQKQTQNEVATDNNAPVVSSKEQREVSTGSGIAARNNNQTPTSYEEETTYEQPITDEVDDEPEYENNGKVIEIPNDKAFNQKCIDMNSDEIVCPVPLIIDYNATWCGPCRQLAPTLAKVQKAYGNKIQIFSVDIDKCQDAAEYFEFDAIPTLVFVDNDGNCEQITGLISESDLRRYIKKYLKVD